LGGGIGELIQVAAYCEPLAWYPTEDDDFVVPRGSQLGELVAFLQGLDDGTYLPVRGRDRLEEEWDFGVAVKHGNRLFFLYQSGDMESFLITAIHYVALVHFAARPDLPEEAKAGPRSSRRRAEETGQLISTTQSSDLVSLHGSFSDFGAGPEGVVIISHGWSSEVGPNYPLIRMLEMVARKANWKVIVPDFRETYKYGPGRGRSERPKRLLEELLCVDSDRVVLVGHSQGGAASSLVCTPRVINGAVSARVVGLLLLGSESALELDGMDWTPPVKHVRVVHAVGDGVISFPHMKHVAEKWGVPLSALTSNVPAATRDINGDCIHHDFLAKDLISAVAGIYADFLDLCLGDTAPQSNHKGKKGKGPAC